MEKNLLHFFFHSRQLNIFYFVWIFKFSFYWFVMWLSVEVYLVFCLCFWCIVKRLFIWNVQNIHAQWKIVFAGCLVKVERWNEIAWFCWFVSPLLAWMLHLKIHCQRLYERERELFLNVFALKKKFQLYIRLLKIITVYLKEKRKKKSKKMHFLYFFTS